MSKSSFLRPKAYETALSGDAVQKWMAAPAFAADEADTTITIYDVIGEDFFGGGFTEKRMAAALRSIGRNDVTVAINSPGGDMFAGLAIYNQLIDHPGNVTVKVMGLAASAASLIAMAGDEVLMGKGSELMLHRCWGLTIGNTHDALEASKLFARFDDDMAEIYAAKSGINQEEILAILDGEVSSDGTWFSAKDAIENGFADGEMAPGGALPSATIKDNLNAVKRMDLALAASHMPRSERRSLIGEVKGGTQGAALTVTHDADVTAALRQLQQTIAS